MRPPLIAVGIAIAANIATGLFFHHGGKWLAPAIGVAVGAWTNALVLLVMAIWNDRLNLLASAVWRAAGAAFAAAAMGLLVGWMAVEMKGFMQVSRPFVVKGAALMAICLAGLLAYLAAARLLRVFTFSALRKTARSGAM